MEGLRPLCVFAFHLFQRPGGMKEGSPQRRKDAKKWSARGIPRHWILAVFALYSRHFQFVNLLD
jgi:hypothetical protein